MSARLAPFIRQPKAVKPPKTYKRYRVVLTSLHQDAPGDTMRTDLFRRREDAVKAAIDVLTAKGGLVVEEVTVVAKRETRWEEIDE